MSAVLSFLSIWIPIVLSIIAIVISFYALRATTISNLPVIWASDASEDEDKAGTFVFQLQVYSKRHGKIGRIRVSDCEIVDNDGNTADVFPTTYSFKPTEFPAAENVRKPAGSRATVITICVRAKNDLPLTSKTLIVQVSSLGDGALQNLLGWTTQVLAVKLDVDDEKTKKARLDQERIDADARTWAGAMQELLQGY